MISSVPFGGYLKQSEVNHVVEVSFDKNVLFGLVELLYWLLNNSKGNTGVLYMYSCLEYKLIVWHCGSMALSISEISICIFTSAYNLY